jgi:hypothetical protein
MHLKLTFVCSRNYFLDALTIYVLRVATFDVPRSGAGTWAHSSLVSARFNCILCIWRVAFEIYLQYAPGISLKKILQSNWSQARSRLEPTSPTNRTCSSIVKSTRWASSARNTQRPLIHNKLIKKTAFVCLTILIYYKARSTKHEEPTALPLH